MIFRRVTIACLNCAGTSMYGCSEPSILKRMPVLALPGIGPMWMSDTFWL